MLAQVGSLRVSQWRYALRRQSRSQAGSFFLAEIRRTTSSLRPRGMASASMSVTKPHLYSWLANVSMVLVESLTLYAPEVPGYFYIRSICTLLSRLRIQWMQRQRERVRKECEMRRWRRGRGADGGFVAGGCKWLSFVRVGGENGFVWYFCSWL